MSNQSKSTYCHVCSAPSKPGKFHHMHYGGITCKSCQMFFQRAVFHGYAKIQTCQQGKGCLLEPSDQSKCSKCRFDKCTSIGMDPNLVLNYKEKQKRFAKGNLIKSRRDEPEPPANESQVQSIKLSLEGCSLPIQTICLCRVYQNTLWSMPILNIVQLGKAVLDRVSCQPAACRWSATLPNPGNSKSKKHKETARWPIQPG